MIKARFIGLVILPLVATVFVGCSAASFAVGAALPLAQNPATARGAGASPESNFPKDLASSMEETVVQVNKEASPGVVNISTSVVSTDLFLQAAQQATGSGFVLDAQGHIVTNNHVVEDAARVEVTFADGSTAEASLVGRDPANDLAVIFKIYRLLFCSRLTSC